MKNISSPTLRLFSILLLVLLTTAGLSACGETQYENQSTGEEDAGTSEEDASEEDASDDDATEEDTGDDDICEPGCEGDLECISGVCGCADDLTRCGDSCVDSENICDIDIENIAFNPSELIINAGTTVRWTNLDGASHTVTSGTPSDASAELFDSGTMSTDDTFEYIFADQGDFPYYCIPHAGSMQSQIIVQ